MMRSFGKFCALFATALALSACAASLDGEGTPVRTDQPLWLGQISPDQSFQSKPVESFKQRKFRNLVRQGTDFSCGAAAVATIFNFAYGRRTNETQVLVNMLRVSDAELVRTKGFSLLDMKNYVEAIGMRGEGYEVDFEALTELRVPVIVLLDIRGYKHFVVLRTVRDGYVHLGDPALGNRIVWRDEFESTWNGIVFAILADDYQEDNVLTHPAERLSAQRLYALRSPVYDAEIYDFGLGPASHFTY